MFFNPLTVAATDIDHFKNTILKLCAIYGNQKTPKRLPFPISQLKIAKLFAVDPLPIFGSFDQELMASCFTTFKATELQENSICRFREE